MKRAHSENPDKEPASGQISGQTTETRAASKQGGTQKIARSTEGKTQAARADGRVAATGRDASGKTAAHKSRVVRTLIAEDRKIPPAQASVMQGHENNRFYRDKKGRPPRTKR